MRIAANIDFKRITFGLMGYGATQHQPDLGVIGFRREHQRRSVAGLFVPRLGIQVDPNDVSALRHISHQSSSLPTGTLISTS
jgi:hypothetical protein